LINWCRGVAAWYLRFPALAGNAFQAATNRDGSVPDGDRAANGLVQFRPNRKRRPLPNYWTMGANVADLVNLKRFKKKASREQAATLAEANRARFGRTKAERKLDDARVSRANSLLDQHRLNGEDAS
jgi:hypothetical protein